MFCISCLLFVHLLIFWKNVCFLHSSSLCLVCRVPCPTLPVRIVTFVCLLKILTVLVLFSDFRFCFESGMALGPSDGELGCWLVELVGPFVVSVSVVHRSAIISIGHVDRVLPWALFESRYRFVWMMMEKFWKKYFFGKYFLGHKWVFFVYNGCPWNHQAGLSVRGLIS